MATAEVDVFCVGYACIDLNFSVPRHPGPNEKVRASALHLCGGGPAANAAVAVTRLGGTAAFGGALGRDAFGDTHIRELEAEYVATGAVRRGNHATAVAAVGTKPDGSRSIYHYTSPDALLPEDALSLSQQPARVLLLDAHQAPASTALIAEARARGIPVVLDAGSVHEGTRLLLDKVDYLVASENFALTHTGEDDPPAALAAMDGLAPFIAITCGREGVYWLDEDGRHHLPAFDIRAMDETGAGDAFHGAFALGLAQNLPPRRNVRRASAAGALTCLHAGARTALPSLAEVSALLGETARR